jgi:hypothetical protein
MLEGVAMVVRQNNISRCEDRWLLQLNPFLDPLRTSITRPLPRMLFHPGNDSCMLYVGEHLSQIARLAAVLFTHLPLSLLISSLSDSVQPGARAPISSKNSVLES